MGNKPVAVAAMDAMVDETSGAILVKTDGDNPAACVNPTSGDGTAAFSTASDAAGTFVAAPAAGQTYRKLHVHNTGANALLLSVDGGTTWFYHPGNFSDTYDIAGTVAIQAKNAVAGANVSGCYRSAS